MSETTPGQTPVERRLRRIADEGTYLAIDYPLKEETAAIDAGREAIALLRSWTEDGSPWDEHSECMFCGERWRNPSVHGKDCAWTAARALLARCEGDR